MAASVVQGPGVVVLWIVASLLFLALVAGLLYIFVWGTLVQPTVGFVVDLAKGSFERNGGDARLYNTVIAVILIVVGEATTPALTVIGIALFCLTAFLQVRFWLARISR